MSSPTDAYLNDFLGFIDASPTPYHACMNLARELASFGFQPLPRADAWELSPGGYFTLTGGQLLAFWLPQDAEAATPFRIFGAHTDSPNLRLKPNPDRARAGFRQVGVEVYGGVLLNSWLDRDLGLAGRVELRTDHGPPEERLFHWNRPLLRVPQLAIHLQREVNDKGLVLDRQQHLSPIWALEDTESRDFLGFMAAELDVPKDSILAFDAMCHTLEPSRRLGAQAEMIAAPRLDNLASCFIATEALLQRVREHPPTSICVLAFFDHEEVGSASHTGAGGQDLNELLQRIVFSRGGSLEDLARAKAASFAVSIDMAHATHPNYADRHEPEHPIRFGLGPVIKHNANQRYATNAVTAARFAQACQRAEVPYQQFVMRTDLPCGSTIGPISSSLTGIPTVDVGIPQLSMHSSRELCGALDPALLHRALMRCLD